LKRVKLGGREEQVLTPSIGGKPRVRENRGGWHFKGENPKEALLRALMKVSRVNLSYRIFKKVRGRERRRRASHILHGKDHQT